jgi:hypothetical protein
MWLGVIVWGILEASTVHWIIYLCFYDKDSTLFTTSYSLFIRLNVYLVIKNMVLIKANVNKLDIADIHVKNCSI